MNDLIVVEKLAEKCGLVKQVFQLPYASLKCEYVSVQTYGRCKAGSSVH